MPYYDLMGLDAITAERVRQMQEEGFTAGHDDEHTKFQLLLAARCYTSAAIAATLGDGAKLPAPYDWPWDNESWKPTDNPKDMLAKAGALIAAEIDRLERIEQGIEGKGPGGSRSVAGL